MIRYLREHTSPPVFVSSAVIALALVLWGVLSASSLSSAAECRQLVHRHELRLALHLQRQRVPDLRRRPHGVPLRPHPARSGRLEARVRDHVVVRDAVHRRHGYRARLLRGERAGQLLPGASRRRGGHARGRAERDVPDLLPLGPAPVGDLHRTRSRAGLLRVPQGPPAAPGIGALPAARGAHQPLAGLRGRRPRGVRHPVRPRHVAGTRGPAGRRRPGDPVRHLEHHAPADHPDPRASPRSRWRR